MRINIKETNSEYEKEPQKTPKSIHHQSDFEEELDDETKETKNSEKNIDFDQKKQRRSKTGHSSFFGFRLLKSCGCSILAFLVVVLIVLWLVLNFFKPIIQQVDALPSDFPSIINLYKPEIANISIQEKADKIKTTQIIKALPEWLISPLWSYLSPNLKTRILAENEKAQPTINELKTTIDSELAQDKTKTVFASWDGISKDKKELFEYYKNQLLSTGFQITEKIDDYDWNLIFSKNNISGAISIYDNMISGGSALDMVISY